MQEGMLFHHLYAPDSGVDVGQMVISLREPLAVIHLRQAWQRIASRHPILRTSFRWQGLKKPVQQVHPQVEVILKEYDYRGLSQQEQKQHLSVFLQSDLQQSFDLATPPLMRLALFRLKKAEYQCIWTFHHILIDGWCFPILLTEVFAFYEALCEGQDLELPPAPPYRDYIDWLQQQDFSAAETFWQENLKGFLHPTQLSIAESVKDTSESKNDAYETQELVIPESVTSGLWSLVSKQDFTMHTVFQGVWALLLSRYSGEEDVLFGSVRAGRRSTVENAGEMIGLFINTIPFRVKIPPKTSVLCWLQELRVQDTALRAYEHTPLIKIQQWSVIPGNRSLFESILVFDYDCLNTILQKQGGKWLKRHFEGSVNTGYPITLCIYAETERLLLKVNYDKRQYKYKTITGILEHFQRLLESIVANPDAPILQLPLLTDTEQRLLVEWNDTQTDYPKDKCIHQLFEEQAERTPGAIAVVFDNQQLTYGELNARANQLARYLQTLGVGPEVLVGTCVERSPEMVVGLLGILKAGGAYVPLDPDYPQERLAFMMADTQTPILLTQQHLVDKLPDVKTETIRLDTDWELISQENKTNPDVKPNPNNLAYVIYTSGSTGKPKGCMITHHNVVRLFEATQDWYQFDHNDVWTLFHSYAFDFSVWELWGALIYGGRLVVVPYMVSRSPNHFYELLRREQVTVLNQTPSAFRQLMRAEESLEVTPNLDLRLIIFGGEALELQSLKPWFERHDDHRPQLINMYGITETTVHVTYRPITTADLQDGSGSVIGIPIPDLQLYILDQHLQPVPIGVTGEMYVGGAGLAKGYLNRPELTQERFIPNPFSNNPEARLYKSGDLARYLPNRDIEYLGRIDYQVKIRGFRIELGEIEALLNQHPAIRESVVVAQGVDVDTRLLAYWVAQQQPAPSNNELRAHLAEKLPDYMIPAIFMELEQLPLNSNGKIDRRALPVPDHTRPKLENRFVPPQSPLEEIVAEIWTSLLKIEQVGIHDNFFELGGHSLQIIQVLSRIEMIFRVQLSPRTMFETPTIAELSQTIITHEAKSGQVEKIADMLKKLNDLPAEQVEKMLQAKRKQRGDT
jgi:amino acid adenylation domain-containing protein